ncbi:MAG: hypothetical protein GY859_05170, partial [Desulfobacterales bacterium]|nr:hypothetical protein [Desulfobacterales bacterium]
HGIEKEADALNLGGYLHALGAILHFREDTALRDLVILNPNWVVDALYTALSHDDIQKNRGHFTRDWLFDLWQNPRSEGSCAYSETECWQLLGLLNKDKFELSYELDEPNHFISPQLLSDRPPVYDIDFKGGLDFRFRYHFMPEGIVSRLIVRLNHLLRKVEGRQLVWRFGAVFEREGCLAEVIQTRFSSQGHREIHIRVTGADHRKMELLTIIRNEIEAIHAKSFRNIRFDILIPCNSDICTASENPNLFVLDDLNRLSGFGDREVRCTKCGGMIHILSLVAGMMPGRGYFDPSITGYKGAMNPTRVESMGVDFLDESVVGGGLAASEITRQLFEILKLQAQNPTPVHVNVQVNVTNEVQGIKDVLGMLKENFRIEVEDDKTRRQLEKELDLAVRAGDSVADAPKERVKNSGAMKRLKDFVEKM